MKNTFHGLSIKTQVRRLKYFSEIINIIDKKGTHKALVEERIINWSKNNTHQLKEYTNSSGEISRKFKSSNSRSFLNYFEGLVKFGLINEQAGLIIPSKIALVLKNIYKTKPITKPKNAFELDDIEKVFYMYNILKKDSDFFLVTSQIIRESDKNDLKTFQKSFKEFHQKRLTLKLKKSTNYKEKEDLNEVLNRVKTWRNPERYSEDIVPPRINWMLDLGLIDKNELTNGSFEFNYKGNEFLNTLKNNEFYEVDLHWMENQFMKSIHKLIDRKSVIDWNNIQDTTNKDDLLKESFFHCLNLFRFMGLSRLSVEQSFLFIQLYLYFKKSVIIEVNDIENWLGYEKIIGSKKFGYRKSARSYESYIIISDEA